jgi:hypothetical protein
MFVTDQKSFRGKGLFKIRELETCNVNRLGKKREKFFLRIFSVIVSFYDMIFTLIYGQ